MQVFKHFLVWAWPGHGFGKEMQEKALSGLGQAMALVRKCKREPCLSWPAAPSSAEQPEQHPDSQARQAASPGHVQIP